MEQHPVPQQISAYQFRLVGDMTLKQFLELAAGALIGLLIYATALPAVLKWPLILFFGLSGVALAFLPFQERPLEQWIFAFFRSVYAPTFYFWQKGAALPEYFQPEPATQAPVAGEQSTVKGPQTTEEQLKEAVVLTESAVSLENAEQDFLSKLGHIFSTAHAPTQQSTPSNGAQQTPASKALATPSQTPTKIVVEEQPTARPAPAPLPAVKTTQVGETLTGVASTTPQLVQFSPEAAPPVPPTQPNTIVGQVIDDKGSIVEGAILEIKDAAGRPVRALKTNRAGHFLVVTPLSNGKYEIDTEKEGFIFSPAMFVAEGKIIPPIAIRANAVKN